MRKRLVLLGISMLTFGALLLGAERSWKGVVSDSNCGAKRSTAGAASAKCVAKCVSGGAKYVLVSDGKVYQLDAQDKFADYAGKSVTVTGSEDGGTITVASVKAGE